MKYEKRKIVHILNEEGVTIPSEYVNNKAGKLVKNYAGKIRIWTVDMLDRILRNPMYCGKTVAGKSRTIGPATKKMIWLPKEKYIVTENTHEALVSQELFDIVQSMEQTRETNGRYKMTDEFRVTPVSGMVRCGICEHKMYRRFYNKKTQKSQYYCYYANEISVIDGKRVWIYQRDSLGNNSAKLEEQKQKMLELAEHHGFEVVGCTTEIASGKKIRRKGIHKIKRVFKKKRADILMVKSLDRLTVNMSCYEELDGWFRMQNV